MDINILLRDWSNTFYTIPLLLVVELTTIIVGITYNKNKQALPILFIGYAFLDFVILLVDSYLLSDNTITKHLKNAFIRNSNAVVSLAESFVYFFFFNQLFLGRHKTLLSTLFLFYFLCFVIYQFTGLEFIASTKVHGANMFSALEFVLLIPPCLFFYKNILKTSSSMPLTERPSFWIVTGIFFYSGVSAPYYLLISYFNRLEYEHRSLLLAIFYYIPFILNFLFIIKAFLCKKPLTI